LTSGLNKTQVNYKERSEVTVVGSRVETENTWVTVSEATRVQHCMGVGPKRDKREKRGEVNTAVGSGSNVAKSEWHWSDGAWQGGSLNDTLANVVSDLACTSDWTRGCIGFADSDRSVDGWTERGSAGTISRRIKNSGKRGGSDRDGRIRVVEGNSGVFEGGNHRRTGG
jgi:hypothetical protein